MDTTLIYQELSPSDWIAITSILVDVIAMLVGAFIAVWIVKNIQRKLDAEQKLKEYFLSEMLAIRNGYHQILDEIYRHEMKAQDFKHRMSSLGILSTDIMRHLKEKYKIDDGHLVTFQLDLNEKITEDKIYVAAFFPNDKLSFPAAFETDLREFEAKNNAVFNEILVNLYKTA